MERARNGFDGKDFGAQIYHMDSTEKVAFKRLKGLELPPYLDE
jgi:hypothetical protein